MKLHLEVLLMLLLVAGAFTQDGFDLNLEDALDTVPITEKPKVTTKPKSDGGFDLNLEDALDTDLKPKTDKPAVVPRKTAGGDSELDLSDALGPGQAGNAEHDTRDGAGQPQEAASGPLAGIISGIGVALVGAVSSYFAYQKKKLCFKIQGGEDPERGKEQQGQPDPQVYSNLLKTS